VIPLDAKPRLAAKAKLRFDRHSQKHMLVYPDRGMILNPSAAGILELCNGERSVTEIVDALHERAAGATRVEVQRDVQAFLDRMLERTLIRIDA
jgi:pyrroloquinoline quinone biosynthesis protein D